eukprot:jgi/Chlat1/7837/Chrsp66S07284
MAAGGGRTGVYMLLAALCGLLLLGGVCKEVSAQSVVLTQPGVPTDLATINAGQQAVFLFNVPDPDVDITVQLILVAGNANLYIATPSALVEAQSTQITVYNYQDVNLATNNTIFIGRNSPDFEFGSNANYQLAVIGVSSSCQFKLVYYLTSQDRTLVSNEETAIQSIFAACCSAPGSCPNWRETVNGTEAASNVCYRSSYCSEEGRLQRLNLTGEGLSCDFPYQYLRIMGQLQSVLLADNQITGAITPYTAETFVSLQSLQLLDLSNNAMADQIDCTLTSSTLLYLDLSYNQYDGPLPSCLFEIPRLQQLHLSHNSFTGEVPTIPNPSSAQLSVLDISNNPLGSTINDALGDVTTLTVLNMSSCQLTGSIPHAITALPQLQYLGLGDNSLSGELPSDSGDWTSTLRQLNISYNQLSGGLPSPVIQLPSLLALSLASNGLSGSLPALGGAAGNSVLLDLDLSDNQFCGPIPDDWQYLFLWSGIDATLQIPNVLNLSNNKLSGDLPTWLASNSTLAQTTTAQGGPVTVSLAGNFFSCASTPTASYLALQCSDSPPSCDGADAADSEGKDDGGISGGAVAAAVIIPVVVVVAAIVGFIWWRRKRSGGGSKGQFAQMSEL